MALASGLFFESERFEPGANTLYGPNYECDGIPFSVLPDSTLYNRIALRPRNAPACPAVYDLSRQRPGLETRVVIFFELEGAFRIERFMERVAIRFSKLLHDNASERARSVKLHAFFDERKILVIFDRIFVEEPSRVLPCIATWLSKEVDDSTSDPVATLAPLELQPFQLDRYQLPTTGALRYVGSCALDGRVQQVTDEELRIILINDASYVQRERRNANETHARCVIKRNSDSGVRVSPNFRRMCSRMAAGHRGGARSEEMERLLQEMALNTAYTAKLENTMNETPYGVIDLSDSAIVWGPGTQSVFMKAMHKALIDDDAANNDEHLFTLLRAQLNSCFAREKHPKVRIWFKEPKSDPEADGADLNETTIALFLKNNPLSFRLIAPEDHVRRKMILQEPIVRVDSETNQYDLLEWYVHRGMRSVNGVRYWPLHFGERLTDVQHRDWINSFRGFRAQHWLIEHARSGSELLSRQLSASLSDRDSDLCFYLQHLKNLCCGSDEVRDFVLTWMALLVFYPREKTDNWILSTGKPGCGKTSSWIAFAQRMLNKAHYRTVKDMIGLVGHFNADAANNSLTIIEEMDFKDQKHKALNALQELVTCKDFRLEKKGIDAKMARNFDHFVANTNVESPIILSTDQRRVMVLVCDYRFNVLLDDPVQREAYLARLARVLDSDEVWKQLSLFLFSKFVPTQERAAEQLASLKTRRIFSKETTRLQLISMIYYPDKSVLGYLFMMLAYRTPLTGRPSENFIKETRDPRTRALTDFTTWDSWNTMRNSSTRRGELKGFEHHDWKKDENSSLWWHKELRFLVYKRYQEFMISKRSCVRPEPEFWVDLEHLMKVRDADTEPLMISSAALIAKGDKESRLEEWVAFAPFPELRKRVERAIPSGLGFTWTEWDKLH